MKGKMYQMGRQWTLLLVAIPLNKLALQQSFKDNVPGEHCKINIRLASDKSECTTYNANAGSAAGAGSGMRPTSRDPLWET